MKLVYGVDAKIKDMGFFSTIVFALQQLLAIMAATIAVPAIVGNGMSASAALFGAGVGMAVAAFICMLINMMNDDTESTLVMMLVMVLGTFFIILTAGSL